MLNQQRVTSVRFRRYKAFNDYSVSLDRLNILVGPNNAGKSTILGAFRILAEGIRKAKAKSPTYVDGPHGTVLGYEVGLANVPVATENVFHNYDEDQPALVTFRLSTGDHLLLFFPRRGVCNLISEAVGRTIKSPSAFRANYPLEIGFVPILGPVEHNEQLYQRDAAREAILSHRASRNFRNIWHHYPDAFDEFRNLLQSTWPGMDIKHPEIDTSHDKPLLYMFCPEERIDREIYWAGFGFQVWCQMLTYMVVNRNSSLFIIDEPDIYLHSELQRQLISALRLLGPDILIATHSTEILLEADANEILLVSKTFRSAKRMTEPSQLREVFALLGSQLNPFLTQVARYKRIVFFEGKDFQTISRFAAKLGAPTVSMRSGFAVVPSEGFNPAKVKNFREGVEATLGESIEVAVVFDRDYRSAAEVLVELNEMRKFTQFVHIHSRKELENFLLVPTALDRAIISRLKEHDSRSGKQSVYTDDACSILLQVTDSMKQDLQAQYLDRRTRVVKEGDPRLHATTTTSRLLSEFEPLWTNLDERLLIVPGKKVLSRVNETIQTKYGVTITSNLIIQAMTVEEVPEEMKQIVDSLRLFSGNPLH